MSSNLNIDVQVISLDEDRSLTDLKQMFPKSSVKIQRGVDLRNVSDMSLYKSGIIGASGHATINEGRKFHWQLNSKGGVGLAHANRLAMSKGSNALLLLEDDYKIHNVKKFLQELSILYSKIDDFDVAVFGADYKGDVETLEKCKFMSDEWYYLSNNRFWLTHCVFYSPNGRKKMATLLNDRPLEMQIDSLFSFWAEMNELRIVLQVKNSSVGQITHVSDIQTDSCKLCDVDPQLNHGFPIYLISTLLICIFAMVVHTHRMKNEML